MAAVIALFRAGGEPSCSPNLCAGEPGGWGSARRNQDSLPAPIMFQDNISGYIEAREDQPVVDLIVHLGSVLGGCSPSLCPMNANRCSSLC